VINWLHIGNDGFEVDVAESNVIAEEPCCNRQLSFQSEGCNGEAS
jgi:hypothetical protein